jgi:hypothetical protein
MMYSDYKWRKAQLEERGLRPTLKRIIFFKSVIARAITLQPLIHNESATHHSSQPWVEGAAPTTSEAETSQQIQQMDSILRMNADLHQKLQDQHHAFRSLQAIVASQGHFVASIPAAQGSHSTDGSNNCPS